MKIRRVRLAKTSRERAYFDVAEIGMSETGDQYDPAGVRAIPRLMLEGILDCTLRVATEARQREESKCMSGSRSGIGAVDEDAAT